MKRVKSAAIFQTLCFSQKPELNLSAEDALKANLGEVEHYKFMLDRSRTKYIIKDITENPDSSVTIHVIKQYNRDTDSNEYLK